MQGLDQELDFITPKLLAYGNVWDDYFDSLSDEAFDQEEGLPHKFFHKVDC